MSDSSNSRKNINISRNDSLDYNHNQIEHKRRLEVAFKSSIDEIDFHNFDF